MNNRRRVWFKNGNLSSTAFISTWRTTSTSAGSSASNQVKLPLASAGTYLFTVNWGDGNEDTITVWNQAETTHTYAASGDYVITITGTCSGFRFASSGDRLKIRDISQWGSVVFSSQAFWGCGNLNVTATDTPAGLTSLDAFFRGCSALTGNSSFANWDVSGVSNFSLCFSATPFNQNIGAWDVSSGTNFAQMFFSNSSFNQNIGDWDVSGSLSFSEMFYLASAFNNGGSSTIGSWDVSSCIDFNAMFRQANSFNQNISGWDVGSGTTFVNMFLNSSVFNQNIGSWDMSEATNILQMFSNASAFNQNLGSWNVSAVTNFTNFMSLKTAANFSTTNLDAIYNGWTNVILSPAEDISFGTAKYTTAATTARALLTRANATVTVTNAVNNGSGLIRITTGAAHGRTTGDKIFISGVTGTTEANGAWIVTVIDATTVDLQASTFTNTYVSGGTFRTGYGWTITDGGI